MTFSLTANEVSRILHVLDKDITNQEAKLANGAPLGVKYAKEENESIYNKISKRRAKLESAKFI